MDADRDLLVARGVVPTDEFVCVDTELTPLLAIEMVFLFAAVASVGAIK